MKLAHQAMPHGKSIGLFATVIILAAMLALIAESQKRAAHEEALQTYKRDASLHSRDIAGQIEAKFRQIYQGIRTLARLPGVRSIDRYASNFDHNARASAQEIYNNLAESVAVSEVYIVPVDFDPDRVDPRTSRPEAPITTFDQLIVGRTADMAEGPLFEDFPRYGGKVGQAEEIEIYEYRLMKEQLDIFKARFPHEAQIDRLSYPAIAGREVITCDNTRYSPSNPKDKDRSGLVYSVPFYGPDGKLRGIVSAVVLTNAVRAMMPKRNFILNNLHYRYMAGDYAYAALMVNAAGAEATENRGLIYSETIDLAISDLTGGWHLWGGLDDSNYWQGAGVASASAKATAQHMLIAMSAVILCFVIYRLNERHRTAQAYRRELEVCIVERTRELATARDAANAANVAKSRFLSIMSHEIRTPLTAIVGMADLLHQASLESNETRRVRAIQSAADVLLNLVNDILDMSKIEAGKIELHPGACSLNRIVSDVVGMFAEEAQKKGIALRVGVGTSLPASVWIDGTRLEQVLLNLVGNAVRHTQSGEIVVTAQARNSAPGGGGRIMFTVADTGAGIPADIADHIFEPFRQGPNAVTGAPGGAGLGLYISRTLVEMMGGSLRFRSEPGRGATFCFDILVDTNRSAGETEEPTAYQTCATEMARPIADSRILLADDNAVSQEITRSFLERLGCEVAVAHDGREAVELATSRAFDLILMDCQMPEMDGLEATRLIRIFEAEAGCPAIPIIALTANAFVQDRAQCLDAGMSAYLSKPFTADLLRQMVAKHLPDLDAGQTLLRPAAE